MTEEAILKLKPINEDEYTNIDLDRLVVYAMVHLDEINIPLSIENIIIASFILFPKKFSILGYPQYPDATRVEKALWRSKSKNRQWIGGKTKHGYILNRKSFMIADEVSNILNCSYIKDEKKFKRNQTRRGEIIIRDIERSSAYAKFISNQKNTITESDLCYLLQGTLNSPKEILKENLELLINLANEVDREDIEKLLFFLKETFEYYLI